MKIIKLSATILAVSLFLSACDTTQTELASDNTADGQTNTADETLTENTVDLNDYWAKDNLDLQRVGNLLERSNSPQEFEGYLNSYEGINNLDLNGDGYADYISVSEFQDRDDHSRGLSLFSRFGPDLIQEIAQIFFFRDEPRYPGARVLLNGNEQIYGDNHFYETNWLDRSVSIASMLFSERDTVYRSPYYYNNYPDSYRTYQVVETPYYRTRVEQMYPQPIFVYTTNPAYFSKIKIKSPNNGLHLGQIKARLVKPTKEQEEFWRNNPRRPGFAKPGNKGVYGKGPDGVRDGKPSQDENPGKGDDRREERPGKDGRTSGQGSDDKRGKPDDSGKGQRRDQDTSKGKGRP
jgi:hypothetical protein